MSEINPGYRSKPSFLCASFAHDAEENEGVSDKVSSPVTAFKPGDHETFGAAAKTRALKVLIEF